ncbi:hypothetical protein [Fluviispira vulneris]|uniref:hypothetical protein n=1 Tax=Fluviispira vulneris TaxID=2763012 RepID=UPI00164819A0|nr:hypothetical protein [Fluviispira vulneris]
MKKILFLCLLGIFNIGYAQENKDTKNYLLTPSGSYSIGYKDLYIINNKICPDTFYHPSVNEKDFSQENNKFCHEINARIYYPSKEKSLLISEYDREAIMRSIHFYNKKFKLKESELITLKTLLDVKTYNSKNAAPSIENKKFPIIIFLPGSGLSVQSYNIIINELVSYGYIILGLNSFFVNGAIKQANGHVVEPPEKYNDSGRLENFADLKFILDNLQFLDYGIKVKQQINFENVNLLGHSMGAMSIVNLFKEKQNIHVNSLLLMDPGNILEAANYPIKPIKIPTMTIWSSLFKHLLKGQTQLGKNNFDLVLSPSIKNINYSNHENFTDLSKLQYHPAYHIPQIHESIHDPMTLGVGLGNGDTIANDLMKYIVVFFNMYAKKEQNKSLEMCRSLDKNSILNCGKVLSY